MKDLSVSRFKATIAACLREVQGGGEAEVASSRLLWVELSRVFHRGIQTGQLDAVAATQARHNFSRFAAGLGQIRLTEAVLLRASGPYPLVIRTFDATQLGFATPLLDGV